jgi:hypothetical protein
MTSSIRKLEPGTILRFEDIRAVGGDSRTRKLPPFWIKII